MHACGGTGGIATGHKTWYDRGIPGVRAGLRIQIVRHGCQEGEKVHVIADDETLYSTTAGRTGAARLSTLDDIPLVVLSRGRGEMSAGPGVSAADAEQHNRANKEMQAELAALSTEGKQIIA